MMPVKKRLAKVRQHRITPEAIEAWKACDYRRLQRELGLAPYSRSPLPVEITALGTSEDEADGLEEGRTWDQTWELCIGLQRELISIAGWPDCRSVYEKHLKEAREWADWCQGRVDDPSSAGKSHGDPAAELAARKEMLQLALDDVQWRQGLLAQLDAEGASCQ